MVQSRGSSERQDQESQSLVGQITKERDIVVASDSKSKLWRDLSLKRAIHNWNMTYVDIAMSPGAALRVFTSSERLANHLKINEIRQVGKLFNKIEMGAPKIEKLVKRIEMGDPKAGKWMKKVEIL